MSLVVTLWSVGTAAALIMETTVLSEATERSSGIASDRADSTDARDEVDKAVICCQPIGIHISESGNSGDCSEEVANVNHSDNVNGVDTGIANSGDGVLGVESSDYRVVSTKHILSTQAAEDGSDKRGNVGKPECRHSWHLDTSVDK